MDTLVAVAYLVAIVLFILGIKRLGKVRTARGGNASVANLSESLRSQLNDEQRAAAAQLVEAWLAEHANTKAGS